jgi:hypothetical protein
MKKAQGMSLADLVLSVLPWPFHKDLSADKGGACTDDGGLSLGMICSFSIPIITICALILLIIIVSLFDFISAGCRSSSSASVPEVQRERKARDGSGAHPGPRPELPAPRGPRRPPPLVGGPQNVREAIRVILMTELRERVTLPEFGGGLKPFLFEPNTVTTRQLVQDRIDKRWRAGSRASTWSPSPSSPTPTTFRRRWPPSPTAGGDAGARARDPQRGVRGSLTMPLALRAIDDRRYKDLLEERSPASPSTTPSGRTSTAATRHHAARAVRVPHREPALPQQPDPERNRMKFLQLLGVPLRRPPPPRARGLRQRQGALER